MGRSDVLVRPSLLQHFEDNPWSLRDVNEYQQHGDAIQQELVIFQLFGMRVWMTVTSWFRAGARCSPLSIRGYPFSLLWWTDDWFLNSCPFYVVVIVKYRSFVYILSSGFVAVRNVCKQRQLREEDFFFGSVLQLLLVRMDGEWRLRCIPRFGSCFLNSNKIGAILVDYQLKFCIFAPDAFKIPLDERGHVEISYMYCFCLYVWRVCVSYFGCDVCVIFVFPVALPFWRTFSFWWRFMMVVGFNFLRAIDAIFFSRFSICKVSLDDVVYFLEFVGQRVAVRVHCFTFFVEFLDLKLYVGVLLFDVVVPVFQFLFFLFCKI